MKIYRSQVNDIFRPAHQNYVWPPRNREPGQDRGVEQDFDEWLLLQDDLLTDNPAEADFNYVPIFWNRYYINTPDEDGAWGGGMDKLSDEFERCKIDGLRTFIISEAGPKTVMPELDWKDVIIFTASRRCDDGGIDIPLLSAPHGLPVHKPKKKYMASFIGSLGTDSVRMEMYDALKNREDCWVEHDNRGVDFFVNLLLSSYIALCPRGAGGQSFRTYEAMQIGTVPLLIGDMDCRPFQNWIDWSYCSFWLPNTDHLYDFIESMKGQEYELLMSGLRAQQTYDEYLGYGRWCRFVIRELSLL